MAIANRATFHRAIRDLVDGFRSIYIWPMLGWQDIKQRYRRSVIGPFWLTISYGAMIAGMGPLYGQLLNQSIGDYVSYLATSFVVWILISQITIDACNCFIGAEGYIKQIKLPLTIHVLRVVWRNVLIFMHNFVIVLIVMCFYRPPLSWALLTLPLGVLMIALNGIWVSMLFGLFGARFRDIPQVVSSVVQVAFFLTPVMWRGDMLKAREWIVHMNPLYHFLEIVRAPLLNGHVAVVSWAVALVVTVVGFSMTLLMFARYRGRVAYWV